VGVFIVNREWPVKCCRDKVFQLGMGESFLPIGKEHTKYCKDGMWVLGVGDSSLSTWDSATQYYSNRLQTDSKMLTPYSEKTSKS
jgi:hypothetical protein